MFHCVCTDITTRFFDNLTISYTILYLIYPVYTIHIQIHTRQRIFIGPCVSLMRFIVISHIIFICIYFRPPGFVHTRILYYMLQSTLGGWCHSIRCPVYIRPTIYIMCRWSVLIIIIIIKRRAARWLIARTKGKKYNAAHTVVWKGIFGLTHHLPCNYIYDCLSRRPPRSGGGGCAPVCKRGIKTCRKSIAGDFVYG